MTEISTRPPFFPNSVNSSTNKSSGARSLEGTDDIALKRNPEQRASEISKISADHVKVDIPEGIKDYAMIKTAVDQAPPIDNSKKVQDLKQKINNGTYEMDYDAIANSMLNSEY